MVPKVAPEMRTWSASPQADASSRARWAGLNNGESQALSSAITAGSLGPCLVCGGRTDECGALRPLRRVRRASTLANNASLRRHPAHPFLTPFTPAQGSVEDTPIMATAARPRTAELEEWLLAAAV